MRTAEAPDMTSLPLPPLLLDHVPIGHLRYFLVCGLCEVCEFGCAAATATLQHPQYDADQ
jgi:hypothetical protein